MLTTLLLVQVVSSQEIDIDTYIFVKQYQVRQYELELLTRIVRAEANPHSVKDKLYMVQLVLNRESDYGTISSVLSAPKQFQGYNSPRFCRELREEDRQLIDSFLRVGIKIHDYKYVINPFIATNKSFRDFAVKQRGEWVGKHWYFMY